MANKFLDLTGLNKFKENLKALFDDTYIKKQGRNVTEADTDNGFSLDIYSSDGINSYISLIADTGEKTLIYPNEVSTPNMHTDKISSKTTGTQLAIDSGGSLTFDSDEEIYMYSSGDLKLEASGTTSLIGEDNMVISSTTGMTIKNEDTEGTTLNIISQAMDQKGAIAITADDALSLKSSNGAISFNAKGDMSLTSRSKINFTIDGGPNAYINGNQIATINQAIHSYGYDDSLAIGRIGNTLVPSGSYNYYWIKYNNGIMILNIQYALGGDADGNPQTTQDVTFPVSFVNAKYVPIIQTNKAYPADAAARVYTVTPSGLTFHVKSISTASNEAGYAEGWDVVSIQCIGRWK